MAIANRAAMFEDSPAQEEPTSPAGIQTEAAREEVIEKLFERVDRPLTNEPAQPALGGLRTARIVSLEGRAARITWRGQTVAVPAEIADEVDLALMRRACDEGESVLVETEPGALVVVGMLQTRVPTQIAIKGETITIEAERELVLRAGRSAIRLREDGDMEIVGSRIAAMSRGLFRIVGRVLRLN